MLLIALTLPKHMLRRGGSLLQAAEQAAAQGRLQWLLGDVCFGEAQTQAAEPGWWFRGGDSMSQQDAH